MAMVRTHYIALFIFLLGALAGAPVAQAQYHSCDYNGGGNYEIDLTELLRFIQFFNSGGYHCAQAGDVSDEGFMPGAGDQSCEPHDGDYKDQDWVINLSELLRVIQFFNSEGYEVCAEGEDGFCPVQGAAKEVTLTTLAEGNSGTVTITLTPPNSEGLEAGHFYAGAAVQATVSFDDSMDRFLYWDLNGNVQSATGPDYPTTVNLQADSELKAVFGVGSIYTLTTGVAGNSGAASVSLDPASSEGLEAGQFYVGTEVTVTPQYDTSVDIFAGWRLNGEAYGAANPLTYTITEDVTLIAGFTSGSVYTLSTEISGNVLPAAILLSPSSSTGLSEGQYYGGTAVTATLSYVEDVESFVGWTIDGSGYGAENPLNFTVNGNHTLEASFACAGSSRYVNVEIVNAYGEPGSTPTNSLKLSSNCVVPTSLDFSFSFNAEELDAGVANVIAGPAVNLDTHTFVVTETALAQLRVQIAPIDPQADLEVNGIRPGQIGILAAEIYDGAYYCDELRIDSDYIIAKQNETTLEANLFPGAIRVVSTSSLIPVADFEAAPMRGLTGMEVQFVDTTFPGYDTSSESCENTGWNWNFGDGGSSTEMNPAHVYTTPGIYTVTLAVTNTIGTDTIIQTDLIEVIDGVTVYVDRDSIIEEEGEGEGDGLDGQSWETAFHTIQEGIDLAESAGGGEVWVADGLYNEYRNNSYGALELREVVHIYGGFSGVETSRNQRDYEANTTIIDGAIARSTAPAYHVIRGCDSSVVDGFTIKGGRANGTITSEQRQGGALYCAQVTMTVRNCIFEDNTSTADGGAIYSTYSNLFVGNCTFSGNYVSNNASANHKSQARGGAINNTNGSILTLQGCSFESNVADSYTSWDNYDDYVESLALGAAIYNYDSNIVVEACSFTDNIVESNGSGSGTYEGGLEIFAATPSALGSGIYSSFGKLDINRCVFSDNEATTNNNGVFATAAGAGIYIDSAQLLLTNSLLVNNNVEDSAVAFRGAAIHIDNTRKQKEVLVVNCTIADNNAFSATPGHGGGISAINAAPFVINSILYYNSGDELVTVSGTATVSHSDIQGGDYLENNSISENPGFVDPGAMDYSLLSTSPCVDTGMDTSPAEYGSVQLDLDGNLRSVFGESYDMGAYEFTGK